MLQCLSSYSLSFYGYVFNKYLIALFIKNKKNSFFFHSYYNCLFYTYLYLYKLLFSLIYFRCKTESVKSDFFFKYFLVLL